MNEDVVHNEVSQAIKGNAYTNPKSCIRSSSASVKAVGTRYRENDEKGIVLFKEAWTMRMMVLMKIPHGSVHQVFVC